GDREERAAGGDQPAGARVGAAQAAGKKHGDAGDDRKAQQPAGLAAEGVVEQPERAGGAAEEPASPAARPTAAATAEGLRPASLAVETPKPVVVEDQREDAVVAGARDP